LERKLAVILALDVVGYSALMERDERSTHERLRAEHTAVLEPEIARHHGRVFKTMGDGLLAEFGSVVDSVECAVALQRNLAERNANVPEDERIQVRIGINLGEVIVEGEDRFGEGVNIAARLEQLSEPGGICVSSKVAKEVEKKLDFGFESLGDRHVKNLSEPISVYRVRLDGVRQFKPPRRKSIFPWRWSIAVVALMTLVGGALFWMMDESTRGRASNGKPSLAVLPFANMAGTEEGGRLADGITEDIITDLSRFKDLDVIARNSTEIYKGKAQDIRKVGSELGVTYVLEGSIQLQADRVRVTGQLIDADTGSHVWANRWDGPAADLFSVQSEISEAVAGALGGSFNVGAITQKEAERRGHKPPTSLDSYDLYLIGVAGKAQRTKESIAKGLAALDQAIALDPSFARAYIVRGWLRMFTADSGVPWKEARNAMGADLKKAYELDPGDADAEAALAYYDATDNKLAEGESLIKEALALNPNSVNVLNMAALVLPYVGHPDEAAAIADRALRLDPRMVPANLAGMRHAYYWSRHFDKVITVVNRIPEGSRSSLALLQLAASYAFLGHAEEATAVKAALLAKLPKITAQGYFADGWYFARKDEEDLFFDTFRVLKLPMCATSEQLASITSPKPLPECPATVN
jgi:TolB-like protein/class 3 adenylate cyclase